MHLILPPLVPQILAARLEPQHSTSSLASSYSRPLPPPALPDTTRLRRLVQRIAPSLCIFATLPLPTASFPFLFLVGGSEPSCNWRLRLDCQRFRTVEPTLLFSSHRLFCGWARNRRRDENKTACACEKWRSQTHPAGTPLTASLSHDRPCLVSTFCTSVGPIKPPPYSRPVSRPFGMFARTFPPKLPRPLTFSRARVLVELLQSGRVSPSPGIDQHYRKTPFVIVNSGSCASPHPGSL